MKLLWSKSKCICAVLSFVFAISHFKWEIFPIMGGGEPTLLYTSICQKGAANSYLEIAIHVTDFFQGEQFCTETLLASWILEKQFLKGTSLKWQLKGAGAISDVDFLQPLSLDFQS